jgi:TonB family protein
MMRQTIAAALLVLAALSGAAGQEGAPAAREEISLGATAYRRGDFAEAQRRFERALELDPSDKNVRTFVARAIHQQYRPGDQTPDNLARGAAAVAAYEKVLEADPANAEGHNSIMSLLGQMKNEEAMREHLLRRANNDSLPPGPRAEALTALAGAQWKCSHDITERNKETQQPPEDKEGQGQNKAGGAEANKEAGREPRQAGAEGVKPVVKYKRPADASDLIRAQQCVSEGLILSEQATRLEPDGPGAWSHRANLLREAAKLAEMEGNDFQKAEYERQSQEASQRHQEASAAANARPAQPSAQPAPVAMPSPGRAPRAGAPAAGAADPARRDTVVPAGVLNAQAVSKPEPAFPASAKAAARAQVVTVRVRVDERGNVTEARAVSGHPLLRPAAEEAARRARFRPMVVRGKPVQVSGVLTYNYAP